MLKNYTVIVKNVKVKKTETLINYLNNNKHKNHTKKNTEIFELGNQKEFLDIEEKKLFKNEENYILNGKGGRRLKVINKSFTFNLPSSYKNITSVEQCKKIDEILKKQIIKIYSDFGVEISKDELYSVLHYQDNPHIHLILPYLNKKGETIRQIKPKGFTSRLKVLFNQVVDKVLETDIKEYKNQYNSEDLRRKTDLNNIKDWYKNLIKIDGVETTYYKNQIKSINRMLEDIENVNDEDITKIRKNTDKVKNLRKQHKRTTPNI